MTTSLSFLSTPTIYCRLDMAGRVLDCKVENTAALSSVPIIRPGDLLSELVPGLSEVRLATVLSRLAAGNQPVRIVVGGPESPLEALLNE